MEKQFEETLSDSKSGKKNNIIKASLASGTAGAALGVAGAAAVQAARAETPDEPVDPKNEENNADPQATPEAQNHDEMSFGDAFAAARAEVGAGGIFKWHGRYYGTYTKDEWQSMSQAEKNDYAQHLPSKVHEAEDSWQQGHATAASTQHVHPQTTAYTQHEQPATGASTTGGTGTNPNPEPAPDPQPEPAPNPNPVRIDPTPTENKIQVLDVETVDVGDGQQAIIAEVKIEGHEGVMVDTDMDGKIDVAAIDFNDNGQIEENEVGRVNSLDIRVEDLQAMQQGGAGAGGHFAQTDLPDYTNDADVSNLA